MQCAIRLAFRRGRDEPALGREHHRVRSHREGGAARRVSATRRRRRALPGGHPARGPGLGDVISVGAS